VIQDAPGTLMDGGRHFDRLVDVSGCCAGVSVAAVLCGIPGGTHPPEAGEIECRGQLRTHSLREECVGPFTTRFQALVQQDRGQREGDRGLILVRPVWCR